MSIAEEKLLLSYRFAVSFVGPYIYDFRFQKVSGLSINIQAETLREGGENFLTHRLPTHAEYGSLILEKGRMTGGANALLNAQITAMFSVLKSNPFNIIVASLDENNLPVSTWVLYASYPVRWSLSDLDASSNTVVIESLELAYQGLVNISI